MKLLKIKIIVGLKSSSDIIREITMLYFRHKLKELGNEIYFLTEKEKKTDKLQKKSSDF